MLSFISSKIRRLLKLPRKNSIEAAFGFGGSKSNISLDKIEEAIQKGSLRTMTISGVKNIIAIASGKGGVGKSTTAVNLALALAAEGARVGILDADIYGPNQPHMLGTKAQAEAVEEKFLLPVMAHGIQSMSIAYLLPQEDTPMVWRGPMVSTALQQLLYQTRWDNIDYLLIDLPPGTGDIQLTLSQKIPVTAAIIVTTPQDIALLDARKAIRMFEKVKVPILGIIENMSMHICSQCGHAEAIFGEGGAERIAEQYKTKLLGKLPLDITIRADADKGCPTVVANPQGKIAQIYREIAKQVTAELTIQLKSVPRFPKIVVENK